MTKPEVIDIPIESKLFNHLINKVVSELIYRKTANFFKIIMVSVHCY